MSESLFNFFKKILKSKSSLGVDIGTTSVRAVILKQKNKDQIVLENYGEIQISSFENISSFKKIEKNTISLATQEITQIISNLLKETQVSVKEISFSIPDYTSFFTNFELPLMDEKEIPEAIRYEARSYIPLPLSEVILDWEVIRESGSNKLKVLMASIPNEVIKEYEEIASLSNLRIKLLETEIFSVARALGRNEKKIISVIDMGARSTTCNILKNGTLKISHSFSFSGNELTEILARSLDIDYETAEKLKIEKGLKRDSNNETGGVNIREILSPIIDSLINEVKKIFQTLQQQENQEIEKIILTGGAALLPGLKEYFFEEFKKEIEIANPFKGLIYPSVLEETLKEIGPFFTIAVGVALKGLE